jgi:hypothetical protein
MVRGAERIDPLLGAARLLVAPRAAEGRIIAAHVERLFERLRLHDVGVARRAMAERGDIVAKPVRVGVGDQIKAVPGCHRIAEGDHLGKLPAGIDVQQRKRQLARVKRLQCQMQKHRGILADRVEHHRSFELGCNLTKDVDCLVLERLEMRIERRLAAPVFNDIDGHSGGQS